MRAVLARRNMVRAACLAVAAACRACASAGSSGPAGRAGDGGQHGAVITVGSFDFPESVLLADLYAGALAANCSRVQLRGKNPRRVAGSWLRAQGLAWPGGASQ